MLTKSFPSVNKELLASLRKLIRPQARNKHDTEDILQNVLVKIIKNGSHISDSNFLPWLQTVCRTTTIDFYRKNKSVSFDSKAQESHDAEDENTSASKLAECVKVLLHNLDPDDSKILKAVELDCPMVE